MSAVIQSSINRIRPMSEADLSAILHIEQAAYSFPWSETIFQDCLRVGYCCWVIESDGVLVGYGVMALGAGESHILNLCVHPDYQRMGLGRVMLEHLLDVAHKHHVDMTFLEVRPSNFQAIKLYMGAGFDEVGVRRNYYPAKIGREDALILARSISTD